MTQKLPSFGQGGEDRAPRPVGVVGTGRVSIGYFLLVVKPPTTRDGRWSSAPVLIFSRGVQLPCYGVRGPAAIVSSCPSPWCPQRIVGHAPALRMGCVVPMTNQFFQPFPF